MSDLVKLKIELNSGKELKDIQCFVYFFYSRPFFFFVQAQKSHSNYYSYYFFFWLNIVFYFCKWSLIMNTGAHSEGVRGFDWSTPFDSKFNFHRTFWIHLINLGHLSLHHFNKSILLPLSVYKIAGWVATLIYTVCSGLSVRIHRVSTVICLNQHPPPQKSSWVRPWHNCYLDKWRLAELQW